jgi:hypothetical protein
MKVKVGHLEYRVLPLPAEKSEDGDLFGLCEHEGQIIYIEAAQTPAEQLRTFFHEVIHAFWHAFNIRHGKLDEEKICDVLESPLAMLFRDNPKLPTAIRQAFRGRPLV